MNLRIATWNVHRCIGTDGKYSPQRVSHVLKAIDADVVALQEVDSSLRIPGEEVDQLAFLERELGMTAVMGPTLKRDYGAYGNALLTRLPILAAREYDLSFRKFEPRGALAVRLLAEGGEVQIINIHLGLKYWERAFQIDRLMTEFRSFKVEDGDPPIFLLGDLNEWFPYSPNLFRLTRAFRFRSPRLKTFPSFWPRFSLDRILLGFAGSSDRAIHAFTHLEEVTSKRASDHLPVVLNLPHFGLGFADTDKCPPNPLP